MILHYVIPSSVHSFLYNTLVHFALHSTNILSTCELHSASAECKSALRVSYCTCLNL